MTRPRHHYLECPKCESGFKVDKAVTSVPAHKCWAAEKEAPSIIVAPTDPAVLIDADGCRVWTLRNPVLTQLADELLPIALRWPGLAPDTALGIPARRQTCAFGKPGATYRYSQTTKVAAAWPVELHALHDEVVRLVSEGFNFALVNLYLDGNAALGWHADDERDLAAGAPIVSVSLARRECSPCATSRPARCAALSSSTAACASWRARPSAGGSTASPKTHG